MKTTNNELQKALKDLEDAKRRVEDLSSQQVKLTPEQNYAEHLHNCFCHWNHIDCCGWEYDKGDWSESSRQDYLNRATKIFNKILGKSRSPEKIQQLYDVMNIAANRW